MARISLQQFEGRLQKWMRSHPEAIERALKRAGTQIVRYAKKHHLTWPGPDPKPPGGFWHSELRAPTGTLRRHVHYKIEKKGRDI